MVRDIDWSNYLNIMYVIKNRKQTDEEIVKGLHSKGSGFSITIKRGYIMTDYASLLELEGNNISNEKLVEFCKNMACKFLSNEGAIKNAIDKMIKKGCTVGSSEGFPECKTGFNESCFKCPFNPEQKIKNDIDIVKFNGVFQKK